MYGKGDGDDGGGGGRDGARTLPQFQYYLQWDDNAKNERKKKQHTIFPLNCISYFGLSHYIRTQEEYIPDLIASSALDSKIYIYFWCVLCHFSNCINCRTTEHNGAAISNQTINETEKSVLNSTTPKAAIKHNGLAANVIIFAMFLAPKQYITAHVKNAFSIWKTSKRRWQNTPTTHISSRAINGAPQNWIKLHRACSISIAFSRFYKNFTICKIQSDFMRRRVCLVISPFARTMRYRDKHQRVRYEFRADRSDCVRRSCVSVCRVRVSAYWCS